VHKKNSSEKIENKIFMCSALWGEEYIEYFENLCLNSLLKKNINKYEHISFYIYCNKDEHNKILQLKNIKRLKKLVSIKYFFFDKKKSNKYSHLAYYQNKLMNIAKEKNYNYFIFCYPDSIFCNNYIEFCITKLKKFSLILSPAPLINFESLPKKFGNFSKDNLSRVGNNCLSDFYKNRIDDFYEKSNINLWKNKYYTYYKSFNLHILGVNLKKIELSNNENYGSFDEDFFTFDNINYKDIYYVKNSQENIILTVESVTSERNNNKADKPSLANIMKQNNNNSIFRKILREKNHLNLFSFLYGDYYVVEKKNLHMTRNSKFEKSLNFLKDYFPNSKRECYKNIKKIKKNIIFDTNTKETDVTNLIYDAATKESFLKYFRPIKNKFLAFCLSFMIFIVTLIPNNLLPIINKFFSRKVFFFNKIRNDMKINFFGTPKKYILKHSLKNMVKIIKNV